MHNSRVVAGHERRAADDANGTAARVTNGLGRKRCDLPARLPRRRRHRIRPVRPGHRHSGAWLIHPDGSRETRLRVTTDFSGAPADFNGFGCCLVLSPDGRKVAVAYDDWSGLFGDTGVRKTQILKLDGARVASVPINCGGCASIQGVDIVPRAWSLDGTVVRAVSVGSEEAPSRQGMGLAQMDGHGLWTQVTGGPDDFPIAFSPDSRRVLFRRDDDGGTLMQGTRREPPNSDFLASRLALRQVSPRGWSCGPGRLHRAGGQLLTRRVSHCVRGGRRWAGPPALCRRRRWRHARSDRWTGGCHDHRSVVSRWRVDHVVSTDPSMVGRTMSMPCIPTDRAKWM